MLLGLLDFPDAHGNARSLSFRRPESLASLDVLIWRPDAIADLYDPSSAAQGRAPLGWLQAQQLVVDTRAWREEFRSFLARGGSLVVLAPAFGTLPLHTPQDIVAYDPLEALPENVRVKREPLDAAAVACPYGEPFRSLFASISDLLLARSSLSQADSQPIAASGGQVCGLYRFVHPGRLMVLPALATAPDREAARRLIEAVAHTVHGLRRSAAQHGSAARDLLAPTAEETRLAQELESVAAQRRQLEQVEFDLRARLAWLRELASLCGEGGDEPLSVAAAALRSLGGRILHEFDRPESAIVEALDASWLLMLAEPGEGADHCRERLAPWVQARCQETGRALQPVVLGLGEGHDGFDAPGQVLGTRGAPGWRFLLGRQLYAACAQAKTDALSRLLMR